MDALMAALVAALLTQAGDSAPWLAAVLADRYRRPATVLVAAALAFAVDYGLAGAGGMLVAPTLTPRAKDLLLACALAIAAVTALPRPKLSDRLAGWRVGAFATGFLGLLIMAFGDSAQLIAAALAARSPVPWLAPVGATLGSLAAVAPAVLLGEQAWRRLPLGAVRLGGAGVMLLAGAVLGLGALQLV